MRLVKFNVPVRDLGLRLHLPDIPNPLDPLVPRDPLEYGKEVSGRNRELRKLASVLLDTEGIELFPPSADNTAELYMNGSDGRGENFSSPLEPIVLVDTIDEKSLGPLAQHRRRLQDLLMGIKGYTLKPTATVVHGLFDGRVEVKCLADNNMAYYIDDEGRQGDLWPSRLIDAPHSTLKSLLCSR